MSHIKHQHQPQLRHLSWQTKPNATGWAAGGAFTHIPLSWAMGERVIGGWAPSGPFPEFCWAMEEPARQGEAGTWRLRHQVDTAATWHISKLQLFNLVSVTIAVASEKLGSILCMIVRCRKMDSYFLFYLTPPLKIKGNCRNWCRNKDWRTTFVFLSPFLWHICHLVQEAFCSLIVERKKNNESSASRPRFYFDPACPGFLFFLILASTKEKNIWRFEADRRS